MLGGGSNLVVADDGFDGHGRRGRDPRRAGRRRRADDAVVRRRHGHRRGRGGLGRPGRAGGRARAGSASRRSPASPARSARPRSRTSAPTARRSPQTIAQVRVWDRGLKGVRTFANADCGFGYRTRRFKADPGRHVVLDVTFQFRQGTPRRARRVRRARRARSGSSSGERAPLADVREAVLGAAPRARAWCSTPTTTTRGAPARSSPTRSSTPARAARGRAGLAAAATAGSRPAPPG